LTQKTQDYLVGDTVWKLSSVLNTLEGSVAMFAKAFRKSVSEGSDRPPVLAWLSRADFARARLRAPEFSGCREYSAFVTERDVLQLTLGTTGVTALIQDVSFAAFENWTQLTGAAVDIDRLDEFAAHWRWRIENPNALARGWLGDPNAGGFDPVEVSGSQWIVFQPAAYLGWREQVTGLPTFDPASLDLYATHVVDCCLPSERKISRSAAHSA
jgi:hypothetical protein